MEVADFGDGAKGEGDAGQPEGVSVPGEGIHCCVRGGIGALSQRPESPGDGAHGEEEIGGVREEGVVEVAGCEMFYVYNVSTGLGGGLAK